MMWNFKIEAQIASQISRTPVGGWPFCYKTKKLRWLCHKKCMSPQNKFIGEKKEIISFYNSHCNSSNYSKILVIIRNLHSGRTYLLQ